MIPGVFLTTFYFTHKVQSQVCCFAFEAQGGIRIFISTTHPKSVIVALLFHMASQEKSSFPSVFHPFEHALTRI
jgi:hypothetical protein